MRHRRRNTLPVVGVAFALLCAQLGGLAHLVLARHSTCPEHAAIVEISAGPRPPRPRGPGGAAPGGPHSGAAAASVDPLRSSRAGRAPPLPRPALPPPSLVAPSPAGPPARAPAVDRRPLYRLAPKNSPPA